MKTHIPMERGVIARARLSNEHLIGKPIGSAADVIRWFGAVQSQDYGGAKWGLAQRMAPTTTEAALDEVFDAGGFLRTHVMRPTWHFVLPEDIRWMLDLTGARVQAQSAGRYRQLELDPATLRKATRAIEKALAKEGPLTRPELVQRLQRAGISPDGQRMPHLLMHAELEQVVISGPRHGRQHTFALLEERAPNAKCLEREEALALLARRYFRSHGPASAHDFAWWSGLTVKDAREGLALNDDAFTSEKHHDRQYFFASDGAEVRARLRTPTVHLLPSFDEYLVAYRHHEPIYDEAALGPRGSFGVLRNLLAVNGQIIGSWKRTVRKEDVLIEVAPLVRLRKAELQDLERAADDYARFVGRPSAEVVALDP